jgi:putative membrane protein
MKHLTLFLVAATVGLLSCKDDDDDNKRSISEPDRTFAMNAAMANQAEIEAAQLVPDRSDNSSVENFATHMISEHTTALNDLQGLVDDSDVTLSTDLDAEHQQLKAKLSALSGIAFDTAYINSQVKDHRKAIALFQQESANGKDNGLKGYANDKLPHLQEHLQLALQLQSSLMADNDGND